MVGSISGSSNSTSMIAQWSQKLFSLIDQGNSSAGSQAGMLNSSDEQSSIIDELFSQLDSDSSDAITQQEFSATLSQIFQEMKSSLSEGMSGEGGPPPPPPADSSGMFNSLDTNSDGSLTVDEMTAGGVPDAEKIFGEIDTDGDGLISQAESDAFDEKMKASGPQTASTESRSESANALQTELIKKLMEMIAQNSSYAGLASQSKSILA